MLARRASKSRPALGLVTMRSRTVQPARRSRVRVGKHRHVPDARGSAHDPRRVSSASASPRRSARTHSSRRRSRPSPANTIRSPSTSTKQRRKERLRRLCASGWHTAATWMKCNLAAAMDVHAQRWAGPGPRPEFGPSPGFSNLKWLKPVYAGETVTFTRTCFSHRRWPPAGLAAAHHSCRRLRFNRRQGDRIRQRGAGEGRVNSDSRR